MAAALATIHRNHAIFVGDEERCSFYSGDRSTLTWVDFEAGRCGLPSTHLGTGTNGLTGGLCANHAAHTKRCFTCL